MGHRALILDEISSVYGYKVVFHLHMVHPPKFFITVSKKQKVMCQHLPAGPALLLPFLLLQCCSHPPMVCSSPWHYLLLTEIETLTNRISQWLLAGTMAVSKPTPQWPNNSGISLLTAHHPIVHT